MYFSRLLVDIVIHVHVYKYYIYKYNLLNCLNPLEVFHTNLISWPTFIFANFTSTTNDEINCEYNVNDRAPF